MPVLAGWVLSLVSGITGWLAAYVGKKVALSAALGIVLVTGWVSLQFAMYGIWTAVDFTVPAFMRDVLSGVMYFMPSNFSGCVSALVVGRVSTWLWREQREYAKAISAIS